MLIGGMANYIVFLILIAKVDLFEKNPIFAIAIGSIVGLIFNFTLAKYVVFKK